MDDEGRSGREARSTAVLLPLPVYSGEACYIAALPRVASEEVIRTFCPASGIVTVRPVTGTDDTTGLVRR